MKGLTTKSTFSLFLAAALLITLLMDCAEARKTFLVKQQYPVIMAPRVNAYDTSWKVINLGNGKYSFIIDNQIQMDIGFDFVQKQGYYGTNSFRHWAFRNNYYYKQEFVTHPTLKLDTFYSGENFFTISKFRTNLFWEFVWFPVQSMMCLQFGWSSDPISFILQAGFNVMQCYKNVIYTLTNWDQWNFQLMRTKGFFDSCRSSDSQTSQVYRWDLYSKTSDFD